MREAKYDVYIINLTRRHDRWDKIVDNFDKKAKCLNPIRFEALEGLPGWKYCALSHLELVRMAKEKNLPYIIVSEDDTGIVSNSFDSDWDSIMQFLMQNPNAWDIFNGNPTNFDQCSQSIELIHKTCSDNKWLSIYRYAFGKTSNFIVYHQSCYDRVINLKTIYDSISCGANYEGNAYDRLLCSIGLKHLTCLNYLTEQCIDYSDIEGYIVNYTGDFEKAMHHLSQTKENIL